MKTLCLRYLLLLDAAVLFLLGLFLILVPHQIETAFHFSNLPAAVSYLIGLWGCVLVTMAFGYMVAANNPVRHVIWIQVGIARGVLECVLGLVYLSRGIVTFSQAAAGIVLAAFISLAYVLLYPRRPRLVPPAAPESKPAAAAP